MAILFRKKKFINLFLQLINIGSLFFPRSLLDAENKVVTNIVEVSTLIGLIFWCRKSATKQQKIGIFANK